MNLAVALRRAGKPEESVAPLRTSGIRLVRAAGRHLRLIRDYVHEQRGDDLWGRASGFRCG